MGAVESAFPALRSQGTLVVDSMAMQEEQRGHMKQARLWRRPSLIRNHSASWGEATPPPLRDARALRNNTENLDYGDFLLLFASSRFLLRPRGRALTVVH